VFSSKTKIMIEKILASIALYMPEQRKGLFRWERGRAYLYIEPVNVVGQGKWEELMVHCDDDGDDYSVPDDTIWQWKRGALVQAKIDFAKRMKRMPVSTQERWQQFIDEKKKKKPSWPMPRRRWK